MHQPKDELPGQMKTCACTYFHIPHHSISLPKLYVIILYCQINHVSIMACNCNYLLFFVLVWLLIVKTDKHLYYCDYATIIHLISLYHDWSTENNTILFH